MKSPVEIASDYCDIGKAKAELPLLKMFILSIFAGAFIAFGAVTAATASCTIENASLAKLISGVIFPVGLIMVVFTGAELFTGNNLMTMSLFSKKISFGEMIRNWIIVYIGNFVGSILVAFLINVSHQLSMFSNSLAASTINTAVAKTSLSFGDAIFKGILCNILVCLAVLMASSTKNAAGKMICIFLPVMVFVTCGFEHCIANMYYIPAGLFALGNSTYVAAAGSTSSLTWINFLIINLIPVTIGNIIGGGLILGGGYWLSFVRKPTPAKVKAKIIVSENELYD